MAGNYSQANGLVRLHAAGDAPAAAPRLLPEGGRVRESIRDRVCTADDAPGVYSTGAVARLLRVAPRTVSKWFDSGLLGGYRLPGSLDRRVPHGDLVAFVQAQGMRHVYGVLGILERPVFLAGTPHPLADLVRAELGPDWGVRHLASLFDAGRALADAAPGAVLALDSSLGRAACLEAARALAAGDSPVRVLGLAGEDDPDPGEWARAGCAGVLHHPADPAALARLVRGEAAGANGRNVYAKRG